MISAKRVVVTSFLVDTLDFTSSITVAFISGSVVMLAEAFEGAADLVSSGLLIFGLNNSLKRPDKNHPFGHGRELYFWTLISALFTLSVSAGFAIYFGWQRFINPTPIHNLFLANTLLIITTLTNGYAMTLSIRRLMGRKSESTLYAFLSSPLIETRATFILDLMGTIASIVGLVALLVYVLTGDARADGLGAMAIGTTMVIMASFLIFGVRDLLVGRSASPAVEEKIKKAALSVKAVKSISQIRTNHIGPDQLLIELDVEVGQKLVTDEIEKIMVEVKHAIRQEVKEAAFIQIELR